MTEWTGTPEEIESAIGQIEADAVTYRQLRELAGVVKLRIPTQIAKRNLSELLVDYLRKMLHPDSGAASRQESVPEPGPGPERVRAPSFSLKESPDLEESSAPAELLLDEDLDVVMIYPAGAGKCKPAIQRRLGGKRGQAAMSLVRDMRSLAEAQGYVVQRQMRRVSGADYGM